MNLDWTAYLPETISHEQVGFANDYTDAVNLIDQSKKQAVIVCMKNVPFERNKNHHISAILPIQNRSFYLHCQAETKNLSLLGASQTIQYTHDNIPSYIRDFNSQVKLQKQINPAEPYEYLISLDSKEGSIELNPNEFIPPTGEGIYAIICAKENMELRKKLFTIHDEQAMVVSNLQRSILKKNIHLDITGVYVYYDTNGNIHGSMAYIDKELHYVSYSQSTSHEFVTNFLRQM